MSRFAELLRAANNLKLLAVIGRSGGALSSVADFVDNMIDSPQMVDSIRRFRQAAAFQPVFCSLPPASFRFQLERHEELAQSVAHGMAIGHQAHCLIAARWEESWD